MFWLPPSRSTVTFSWKSHIWNACYFVIFLIMAKIFLAPKTGIEITFAQLVIFLKYTNRNKWMWITRKIVPILWCLHPLWLSLKTPVYPFLLPKCRAVVKTVTIPDIYAYCYERWSGWYWEKNLTGTIALWLTVLIFN